MSYLRLLGGAMLEDAAGDPVRGPPARPQQLALLALLATAPARELSRSKLVGVLWRETSERRARNRLSTCVHRVRSGLGDEVVLSVGDDVRLDPEALVCDVVEFERALEAGEADRAVELYEGPFLDGFRLKDAPAFEKWMDGERERYARRHRMALESLAEEAEQRGEPREAARWWRELVLADPYDSGPVARLMETLATAGSKAEALRAARDHERLLADELGTEPGPRVQELAHRLRAGDLEVGRAETAARESDARSAGRGVGAGNGSPGDDDTESREPIPDGDDGRGYGDAGDRRLLGVREAAVLGALLLAAGGAWHWLASHDGPSPGVEERSVAVLPFGAIGPEDPGPIAEGLHGTLLTRLSKISGLDVTSAASVEEVRSSDIGLPAIADTLGVRWIVEGEVQKSGGNIQVNAQLVDPRTETHAWADTYRRDLSAENLFELQADLANRIARSLQAELSPRERERIGRQPTADLEAYGLYARGRSLVVRRTDSAMTRAEALFRGALRLDSTFAPAWAALAKSLVLSPERRGRRPDSVFPLGREAARRALELDPELAGAHMALSIVDFYRMRAPAALRRLRRTIQLEPSHAIAYHGLNLLHLTIGRPREALKYAQRAVALDPMATENHVGLAWAAVAAGDHERALNAARRAQEIGPPDMGPYLEGYALYRLGELTEGDTAVGEAVRRWLLTVARATSGDDASAERMLSEFEKQADRPLLQTGLLQAALGRRREAMETFEDVVLQQDASAGGIAITLRYLYPDVLGPLRRSPGWKRLKRTLNSGWGLDPDGSLPNSLDASLGSASESRLAGERANPPSI